MLIVLDRLFQFVFFGFAFVGLFYKAYVYNYVAGYFGAEIVGVCALFSLQVLRLFVGSKGNKCEASDVTFSFLILTIITVATNVYYIQYQTYVLLIDVVIGAISLSAGSLEFIFGCFAAIEFKSLENSR